MSYKGTKYEVIPTTKERLYSAFVAHRLNSISDICHDMGRANNYINEQLRGMGGVAKATAAFLEAKYGIKREEYEIKPEPPKAEPVVPAPTLSEWDSDKLYGIVFTAAINGTKKAMEDKPKLPAPVKMDLCPACYHRFLTSDYIHKVTGGVDCKITCGKCGNRNFGGTYEVLRREGREP